MSFSKESMEPSGHTSFLDIPFKKRKDSRLCDESDENAIGMKKRKNSNESDQNAINEGLIFTGTLQSALGEVVDHYPPVDHPSENNRVAGDEGYNPFFIRDGVSQIMKTYVQPTPSCSSQTTVTTPLPVSYSSDSWNKLTNLTSPCEFLRNGRSFEDRTAYSRTKFNSGLMPPNIPNHTVVLSDDESNMSGSNYFSELDAVRSGQIGSTMLPRENPLLVRTTGYDVSDDNTLNLSQRSAYVGSEFVKKVPRFLGGEGYRTQSEFSQQAFPDWQIIGTTSPDIQKMPRERENRSVCHPSTACSLHSVDVEPPPSSTSIAPENIGWRESVPSKCLVTGRSFYILDELLARERGCQKPQNLAQEVRKEVVNIDACTSQERDYSAKCGLQRYPRDAPMRMKVSNTGVESDKMENTRKWVLSTQRGSDTGRYTKVSYNEFCKTFPHRRLNDADEGDNDDADDATNDMDIIELPRYGENRDKPAECGSRNEMLNLFPHTYECNLARSGVIKKICKAIPRAQPDVQQPSSSRSSVPNIVPPHYGSITGIRRQLEPEQTRRTQELHIPPVPLVPVPLRMFESFPKLLPPFKCSHRLPSNNRDSPVRTSYPSGNSDTVPRSGNQARLEAATLVFNKMVPIYGPEANTAGTLSGGSTNVRDIPLPLKNILDRISKNASSNAASGTSLTEREKYCKKEVCVSNEDEPALPDTGRPECAICLDILSSKRGISSTVCGHVYCTKCINEVLEKKKECPTCRKHLDASEVHPLFLFT